MDQIYNVGSYDEISNITLCHKMLTVLDIPHSTQEELRRWVKYTHDRPFNDHRYAVDGTKLRNLGWDQRTTFAEGLAITVDWYRQFGETWWGDITQVLTPFPTGVAKPQPADDAEADWPRKKKRALSSESESDSEALLKKRNGRALPSPPSSERVSGAEDAPRPKRSKLIVA